MDRRKRVSDGKAAGRGSIEDTDRIRLRINIICIRRLHTFFITRLCVLNLFYFLPRDIARRLASMYIAQRPIAILCSPDETPSDININGHPSRNNRENAFNLEKYP